MKIITKNKKKLIEIYVSKTISISYKYLVRLLNQIEVELPRECETEEAYIHTLNMYQKMLNGNEEKE